MIFLGPAKTKRSIHASMHDDVMTWKYFPHYWTFMCGIPPVTAGFPAQRTSNALPVDSLHKGSVMPNFDTFSDVSLHKPWTNSLMAGDLRRQDAHCDVTDIALYGNRIDILFALSLWCHQIKTFSALLSLCAGNHWSAVDSPHKGTVMRNFGVPLLLIWTSCCMNIRLTGNLRHHCDHLTPP